MMAQRERLGGKHSDVRCEFLRDRSLLRSSMIIYMKAILQKWGNSLAIRIPRTVRSRDLRPRRTRRRSSSHQRPFDQSLPDVTKKR